MLWIGFAALLLFLLYVAGSWWLKVVIKLIPFLNSTENETAVQRDATMGIICTVLSITLAYLIYASNSTLASTLWLQ